MSYARRNLQLSPYTGAASTNNVDLPPGNASAAAAAAAAAEFGMENVLMDPRWSSMGQYLGDSRDLLELERRAQMQISKFSTKRFSVTIVIFFSFGDLPGLKGTVI